jgi:hypothetical protein
LRRLLGGGFVVHYEKNQEVFEQLPWDLPLPPTVILLMSENIGSWYLRRRNEWIVDMNLHFMVRNHLVWAERAVCMRVHGIACGMQELYVCLFVL